MRSLLVATGAFCALTFSACMTDSGPANTAEQSAELTTDSPAPEVVQVPEELAFTNLADDDQATASGPAQPNACSVTLVYCHDPRWTPHYPSYCSNGCSGSQGVDNAAALCRKNCGSAACSTFYNLGGC